MALEKQLQKENKIQQIFFDEVKIILQHSLIIFIRNSDGNSASFLKNTSFNKTSKNW